MTTAAASHNVLARTMIDCFHLFVAPPDHQCFDFGLFNLDIDLSNDQQRRHAALLDPVAFHTGFNSPDVFSFIWDTGASSTVSPDVADFIGGITPLDTPISLDGLATGLTIQGKGQVKWIVETTNGTLETIHVDAYYTPGARVRLLSPQSYLQQCHDKARPKPTGGFSDTHLSFTWPDGNTLLVPYNKRNNLPVSLSYNESVLAHRTHELHLCVTDTANQNLSEAQKELLRWHFRLGHLHFASIQLLLRSGALATSEGAKSLHRAASKCELPKCASCQFGKMKRRPTPSSTTTPVPSNTGALKKGNLLPGQHVSVDHFICKTKGRLYDSKGKTAQSSMYSGGAIFVDHATGFIHVTHQVTMNTHQTLLSKARFEAEARDSGVIIQAYTSDNGAAFSSADFAKHLTDFKQTTNFAGVGAHHHNGVAERNIQTIMSMARTMMLHAAIRWPDTADTSLWPMAVDYAVYIHNHLPKRDTGLSPLDLFSGTKWPTHKCNDLNVWGCPVYVLDSTMQDGKKLPRWKTRSRRAVFVGLSTRHASTAPLVLNLSSLYISPQFHCVFDSWFSTVIADSSAVPDPHHPLWANLFGSSRYQYYFDDYDLPPLGDDWDETATFDDRTAAIRAAQDAQNPTIPLAPPTPPLPTIAPSRTTTVALREPDQVATLREPPAHAPDSPASPTGFPPSPLREVSPVVPLAPHASPPAPVVAHQHDQPRRVPAPPPPRRSTRSNLGTKSAVPYHEEFHLLAGLLHDDAPPSTPAALAEFATYVASTNDPDTLTYDQALRDADSPEWKAAMLKEIDSLTNHQTWLIVDKASATTKILPGTWTLRRKRHPDGTIKSLKARWCVRGDLQDPVADTFAPVVLWSTIRLLLYFTLFFDLKTRCIDFSNAFVQAELLDPIFVHLPRGFHSTSTADVCLKLQKSLYGISQAPKLWFEHLKAKLLKRGFTQSSLDPCLFYSDHIILVIFVDDIILASKTPSAFDLLIADLKADSELTDEGELTTFLGIQVTRNASTDSPSTFTLTQPGLTARIITALDLVDGNPKWTPTTQAALGSDSDGPPFLSSVDCWDYRSVIGMLLYLSNNSRPDIAFAVHQCARFSHAPKQSHALAVKSIGRYLLRTPTNGLILQPSGDLAIDCYVDADFAGLWTYEHPQNPLCVKSRTGYLITIGGCPLTWCSKLQTEIALSTMEAEYIALSQSMRELLPIRALVREMSLALKFTKIFELRTHSKIFEDNNGALILASSPRMTPRSKHIAVKYHFFRSYVADGSIKIYKINTEDQKADIFTKGLVRVIFERVRKLLMGW